MRKGFLQDYAYPVAVLSAGTIGVGFLALPYVAMRSGVWVMVWYFVFLTSMVLFLNLAAGEVCLLTPDFNRWPGFIGHHFGVTAKRAVLVPIVMGYIGVLLAYLVVGGQFLNDLVKPWLGSHGTITAFVFFVAVSAAVFFGGNAISRFEFLAISLLVLAIVAVLAGGASHISLQNLFTLPASHGWFDFFLPYGALMFSLWGIGLIPEVEEMLRGRKYLLPKVITWATLLIAGLYFVFTFAVVGITGTATTDSALEGLSAALAGWLASVVIIIGLLAAFAAFVAQGLLLKQTLRYDLRLSALSSWLITCVIPLALYLLGLHSFITVVSLVGGILVSIEGVLTLLMYQKIGGKKVVVYPLILVFVFGIIYSLAYVAS